MRFLQPFGKVQLRLFRFGVVLLIRWVKVRHTLAKSKLRTLFPRFVRAATRCPGARLCPQDQPQRVRLQLRRRNQFSTLVEPSDVAALDGRAPGGADSFVRCCCRQRAAAGPSETAAPFELGTMSGCALSTFGMPEHGSPVHCDLSARQGRHATRI